MSLNFWLHGQTTLLRDESSNGKKGNHTGQKRPNNTAKKAALKRGHTQQGNGNTSQQRQQAQQKYSHTRQERGHRNQLTMPTQKTQKREHGKAASDNKIHQARPKEAHTRQAAKPKGNNIHRTGKLDTRKKGDPLANKTPKGQTFPRTKRKQPKPDRHYRGPHGPKLWLAAPRPPTAGAGGSRPRSRSRPTEFA